MGREPWRSGSPSPRGPDDQGGLQRREGGAVLTDVSSAVHGPFIPPRDDDGVSGHRGSPEARTRLNLQCAVFRPEPLPLRRPR